MASNNWVKIKEGAKDIAPLLIVSTAIVAGYAIIARIFFMPKEG